MHQGHLEQLKGMAMEAQAALEGFWGGGRLQALATALVKHLFPLTEKDLESW